MSYLSKSFFYTVAGAAAALTFASTGQAQTVLTLGDIYAQDHSNSLAEQRFAELVEEKTNGEVKIEVYVDSVLGNERELAESVVVETAVVRHHLQVVDTGVQQGVDEHRRGATDTEAADGERCTTGDVGHGLDGRPDHLVHVTSPRVRA